MILIFLMPPNDRGILSKPIQFFDKLQELLGAPKVDSQELTLMEKFQTLGTAYLLFFCVSANYYVILSCNIC